MREGPLESQVGEKRLVFIFGRGPTQPGALPWLISPPSPELWLRYRGNLYVFNLLGHISERTNIYLSLDTILVVNVSSPNEKYDNRPAVP